MQDQSDRLAAALSGTYAIQRALGAGGMATVYLTRDLKHERDVAVKVLRPDLAAVVGSPSGAGRSFRRFPRRRWAIR